MKVVKGSIDQNMLAKFRISKIWKQKAAKCHYKKFVSSSLKLNLNTMSKRNVTVRMKADYEYEAVNPQEMWSKFDMYDAPEEEISNSYGFC